MDRSVSRSIENHSLSGLPVQSRSLYSKCSPNPPFGCRSPIERKAKHSRTASLQVLPVDGGLPSPPGSDYDESDVPEEGDIVAVRKALRGLHCSRYSSLSCQFGSPPLSDSEEVRPSPQSDLDEDIECQKENKVRVEKRRPRRPLLFFQDGPTDETGQPSAYTGANTESWSLESTPFPSDPLEISSLSTFESPNLERRRRIKRRCVSTGVQYISPPNTPDRFISYRSTSQDASHNFRITKKAQDLSTGERLFRQSLVSADPFGAPSAAGRRRISSSPIRNASRAASSRVLSGSNLVRPNNGLSSQPRQISNGAIWNVGGSVATAPSGPIGAIDNGRGGLVGSGTNAPMYTSRFLDKESPEEDRNRLEGRLAAALDIDPTSRVLSHSHPAERGRSMVSNALDSGLRLSQKTIWTNGQWVRPTSSSPTRRPPAEEVRAVPITPFRVLDAPQLRDDYYCSVLAYSESSRTLAVGLNNRVYLWSEGSGVQYPVLCEVDRRNTYVTSLSFSSAPGGHSILAMGRNDGHLALWSLNESSIKFEMVQPNAVACLAFKPVTTKRPSVRFGRPVETEELLVGDELGQVYYYSIEWMTEDQVAIHGWNGAMTVLAKIKVHDQQICGLAWSPDGEYFATGANDNACCLFKVQDMLKDVKAEHGSTPPKHKALQAVMANFGLHDDMYPRGPDRLPGLFDHGDGEPYSSLAAENIRLSSTWRPTIVPAQRNAVEILEGCQKHKWLHSAAIKAIAFCPWQRGLIATGGGSNDRAIHFYHTFSGASLATIDVQAQVTSLIWSTSRREIAATFGYAQPEHPYRIAVFSWPECRQVVAIPWANEMRALLAIAYPGGPNETSRQAGEGETWWSRTAEEGCIVVAASDESVKFQEVWIGSRKSTGGSLGLLGGSDILEGLEGIDKDGSETIR